VRERSMKTNFINVIHDKSKNERMRKNFRSTNETWILIG